MTKIQTEGVKKNKGVFIVKEIEHVMFPVRLVVPLQLSSFLFFFFFSFDDGEKRCM